MRAYLPTARQLLCGLLMPLVLVLVACATSPTEDLVRAEKLLSRLESKGANQYMIYEMAEVRRQIEVAKKFIRKNHFEVAGESLYRICQKLDSCGVAFMQLRKLAAFQSKEQVRYLLNRLSDLQNAVAQLPRQTYVDQNRYDIHIHRIERYHETLNQIKTLLDREYYPEALRKGNFLVYQLEKTFTGLITTSYKYPSTNLKTKNITKNNTQDFTNLQAVVSTH